MASFDAHFAPTQPYPRRSQTYLTTRDIPTTQHQAILDFTHGHPLALSLVAEVFAQGKEISFQAESAPNVVKTLFAPPKV